MLETLIQQIQSSSMLEIIAACTGIVSVYFSYKENILVFPFGIISVTIYCYLLFKIGIYGDALVNAYYLIMSVYGWYLWDKKVNDSKHLSISKLDNLRFVYLVALILFFVLFIYFILSKTDSTVPFWDSCTTALAIVGMYLMAKKKIEHWYAWIVCNLISVPLYIHKEFLFTSLQFLIFAVIAIMGLLAWRKKLASYSEPV